MTDGCLWHLHFQNAISGYKGRPGWTNVFGRITPLLIPSSSFLACVCLLLTVGHMLMLLFGGWMVVMLFLQTYIGGHSFQMKRMTAICIWIISGGKGGPGWTNIFTISSLPMPSLSFFFVCGLHVFASESYGVVWWVTKCGVPSSNIHQGSFPEEEEEEGCYFGLNGICNLCQQHSLDVVGDTLFQWQKVVNYSVLYCWYFGLGIYSE